MASHPRGECPEQAQRVERAFDPRHDSSLAREVRIQQWRHDPWSFAACDQIAHCVIDCRFEDSFMNLSDLPGISTPPPIADRIFVYILATTTGAYYVGSAKDVRRRMRLHRSGRGAKFTGDHGATSRSTPEP